MTVHLVIGRCNFCNAPMYSNRDFPFVVHMTCKCISPSGILMTEGAFYILNNEVIFGDLKKIA